MQGNISTKASNIQPKPTEVVSHPSTVEIELTPTSSKIEKDDANVYIVSTFVATNMFLYVKFIFDPEALEYNKKCASH